MLRHSAGGYASIFVPGDSVLSVSGLSATWTLHSLSGGYRDIRVGEVSFAVALNSATATSYIATTTGKLFSLRHPTGVLTELVDTPLEFFGLALDEAAQLAYVGTDASVEVFDISTGRFIRSIPTSVGIHLTLSPDRRRLYVSGNATLSEIDLNTLAQRPLGPAQATAITADGRTLYAVTGAVEIRRITVATGATEDLVTLPCGAWGLALTRDESQLYAACPNQAGLQIVDIRTRRVVREHRLLDGARRVAFDGSGTRAAIGVSAGVAIIR